MKKVILIGILSVATIFGSTNIWASHKNGGKQKAQTEKRKKGDHDPDKKLEKWKKELDLTDKQVADLKVVFQQHKEKMKTLKAEGKAENKDDRMALRKEMKAQINNILDEKQKAKLKEMRKQHKGKKGHKKGNKPDKK